MKKRYIDSLSIKEWELRLRETTEKVFAESKRFAQSDKRVRPLLTGPTLFAPIDFGMRETAQTRALAHLLDPERSKEYGLKVLKKLLSQFSPTPGVSWSSLKRGDVAEVSAEKYVGTGKERPRLDVYACGNLPGLKKKKWVLAIEAKISAAEGIGQLPKIKKQLSKGATLIYLTKGGYQPTVSDDDWNSVSYDRLVGIFLRAIPESAITEDAFLRLYLAGLLRDVEEWPEWTGELPPAPFEWLGLRSRLNNQASEQREIEHAVSHRELRCAELERTRALALWAQFTPLFEYLEHTIHEVIRTIPAPSDEKIKIKAHFLPNAVRPLFASRKDVEDILAIVEAGEESAYEDLLRPLIQAFHDKACGKVQTKRNSKTKRRRPYTMRQNWVAELPIRPRGAKKSGKCAWLGVSVIAPTKTPDHLEAVTWLYFPDVDRARQFNSRLNKKKPLLRSLYSSWDARTICMGREIIRSSHGKVKTDSIVKKLLQTITVNMIKRAASIGSQ